jgi:hypothetical protein
MAKDKGESEDMSMTGLGRAQESDCMANAKTDSSYNWVPVQPKVTRICIPVRDPSSHFSRCPVNQAVIYPPY